MIDCDVGIVCDGFEAALAFDGGVGVSRVLAEVKDEATGVVHKEAATGEASVFGTERGVESPACGRDTMVGRDAASWAKVALL